MLRLNVCVPHETCLVKPPFHSDGVTKWDLWEATQSTAFMLVQRAPLLLLLRARTWQNLVIFEPGSWPWPDNTPANTLILDSQAPGQ